MCKVSLLISLRITGGWSLFQLSQSERKGKLRTHRQCVMGLSVKKKTTASIESQINLSCINLDM